MTFDLAPPDDFLQILQRVWWRLDRALDEDLVRASALVGGMEGPIAARGPLPEAERAAAEVLSVPVHPWLTDTEVDRVATALAAEA